MYYDDDKVPSAEEKKQFEDMLKSKAEATYEKERGHQIVRSGDRRNIGGRQRGVGENETRV